MPTHPTRRGTTELPPRGLLQSRAAATVGGFTLRPLSGLLPAEQFWGVWAARQVIAGVMDTFGPSLSGTRVEPVDVRLADGRRVVGEWVYGRGVPGNHDSAIYYLHGSGYVLCSPRTHRRLTAWLSRLTGQPVFCVDYRLAPKYRFPTAATDVRAGWDWLHTELGIAPDRIVMAGDSAGGHLAVDLLLQPGVPHPAALALFSPLFDMTFGLARTRDALRRDPAISPRDAARLVGLYCGAADMAHPGLTLDVRNGRRLPPTLIQAGGAEMLLGDARRLHEDLRAAGADCELQVWPDQVHVFQALPKLSPEARPAMHSATAFLAEALHRNTIADVAG
ncbi:alpha/beta hydrolase [Mycolicibacterium fluoranthenivorans]|uniref:Acetyl esterase/lipase n=1 Tax=Mycolicibacterium fluoranthenivorans TaxID=258505 RepID=A0A7X5TXJ3_9MYCO|nr:alpha/beta hydrolase [Mycolicibacterium fluoranthenivorans]MCV7359233.1 alpha/beta hydrolase [Mycolicibacterium fluoranthenivorans]NIH94583.1 acetyl esterase/lipase [Mycolicibacterium fluoranthenivorans]